VRPCDQFLLPFLTSVFCLLSVCVQKILKLESQNKELREQKETLEVKLQEKTEEMKGVVTKGNFKETRESRIVRFSAN